MSKGSKQRPTNKPKFDKNYGDIDWKRNTPVLNQEQIDTLLKEVKVAFKKDS
tara:strand:+ start:728 stop:883 length:156 start_codon:yes stop_codon:yes gene_type:complete